MPVTGHMDLHVRPFAAFAGIEGIFAVAAVDDVAKAVGAVSVRHDEGDTKGVLAVRPAGCFPARVDRPTKSVQSPKVVEIATGGVAVVAVRPAVVDDHKTLCRPWRRVNHRIAGQQPDVGRLRRHKDRLFDRGRAAVGDGDLQRLAQILRRFYFEIGPKIGFFDRFQALGQGGPILDNDIKSDVGVVAALILVMDGDKALRGDRAVVERVVALDQPNLGGFIRDKAQTGRNFGVTLLNGKLDRLSGIG